MLNTIFNFVLGPPPPGGPGGGSGLPFYNGNRMFWADSGPNPVIFNLYFGLKRTARKSRAGIAECWGSKQPPDCPKPRGKGGGLRPPRFSGARLYTHK